MTIEHRTGDLFTYDGVIAHGCNTHGVMGAGIARVIADKWPSEVYRPYMEAVSYKEFVPGSAQFCHVVGQQPKASEHTTAVVNVATQDHPGPYASYWWITLGFSNMFELLHARGIHEVAIPRIGCHIGGLKWYGVEEAIMYCQTKRTGIDVVVYTQAHEVDKVW